MTEILVVDDDRDVAQSIELAAQPFQQRLAPLHLRLHGTSEPVGRTSKALGADLRV